MPNVPTTSLQGPGSEPASAAPGGGVCVYVRSDIGFNQRMDLNNDQIEAVLLNILLPKSKPILVGACYRPPDQTMFYAILEEVCSKCTDCNAS